MRLPKTPASQTVTVKRFVEGHYDENHNWVDAHEATVATIANASILPKSGRERAAEVQTVYESDYTMWVGRKNITFEPGFSTLERGDIVIDGKGRRFRIVFPGDYGPAFEVSMKEELSDGD